MLPSEDDFSLPPGVRSLALKAMVGALGVVFAVATLLMVMPQASDSGAIKFAFGIAFTVVLVAALALITTHSAAEKAKRGAAGLDMYSVIDRLVDDLDDDEAAYLQRQLDERAAKAKNDLMISIDDLLEDRQSRSS